MRKGNIAEIDLKALEHNLEVVRKLIPQKTNVLAMIKANAYGHDMVEVAHALTNANTFGVATLSEAIILRESGVIQPILLMAGVYDEEELALCEKYQFNIVVHHLFQIELLEKHLSKKITPWLKIDTGMNRLGISLKDTKAVWTRLIAIPNIENPKIMTHFACADELKNPLTKKQIANFEEITQDFDAEKSLANSSGTMCFPDAYGDWIRPGTMLYGMSLVPEKPALEYGLKPVMTFYSEVLSIKSVKVGESIGYGSVWTAKKDTKIAIIGAGYGDGYPRCAKNGTPVLIKGKRYPIIGRVSMDMLTVDITDAEDINIDDGVILWGKGLPIEEVAAFTETIGLELTCRLTNRVEKVFI